MRVFIAASRPFHLIHLARELAEKGVDTTFFSYVPNFFIKRYGIGKANHKSFFWSLLPWSILALQKKIPGLQKYSTYKIMKKIDLKVSSQVDKCDVFIGLSGVYVESFKAAKKVNALSICDRASSHISDQCNLVKNDSTHYFPSEYIHRELAGYAIADKIALPSIFSAESFFRHRFEQKIFINNYGVNLSRFQPSAVDDKNRRNVLFVGGWNIRKSCDLVYDLAKKYPDITITHAGSVDEGSDYPVGLNNFRSLGHVSNKDLYMVYSMHDVLILPSREDGFGMVLLESLACGTPIIGSKNTGCPDIKKILKDDLSVTVLEELTTDCLVAAIEKIVNKKTRAIFTDVEKSHFSWEKYSHRYLEFIEEHK